MRNLARLTVVFLVALIAVGCTSHPLGISNSDWEQLSAGERLKAITEQARLDEAKAERKAAEKKRTQEIRAERRRQWAIESLKEDERQERLAATRHQAPYGNVIQCNLSNASAKFGKNWQAAQSVSFELQRGEEGVDFSVARTDRSSQKVYAEASFDGLNVKVCRSYGRDCDTLAGSEQAYRRGKSKTINIKNTVKGKLHCSLPRRW